MRRSVSPAQTKQILTLSGPGQAPGSGLSPRKRGSGQAGQLFIAMACYEGQTLKEKIARGRLPVTEALGYATQIAEGLQAAHEVGIVGEVSGYAQDVITGGSDLSKSANRGGTQHRIQARRVAAFSLPVFTYQAAFFAWNQ